MASPAPAPSYLNSQPTRTPKLTYRTKSDNASLNTSATTASSQPLSPVRSDAGPSPRYSRSDTYSQLEGGQPSSIAPPLSPHQMAKSKKKKTGFFSGLFSTREPSAQALLDYQKQLLKSDNPERKGRASAVGLGVSSAKLPPTVPKVNSKWDGVPPPAKQKEKKKLLSMRKSMSQLTPSTKTEHSNASTTSLRTAARPPSRGTLGGSSVNSLGSGNQMVVDYGWDFPADWSSISSRDGAQEHKKPSTGRSGSRASSFRAEIPETPKIPQAFLAESATQLKGSLNLPDHSHSPSLTPYNSTPATPNSPSPMKTLASSKSVDGLLHGMKTTTFDAPASRDEVVVKSSGYGILAPPASAKRRPKTTDLQPSAEVPKKSNISGSNSAHHAKKEVLKKSGTISGSNSTHQASKEVPKTSNTISGSNSTQRPSTADNDTPSSSNSNKLRRTNSARERLNLGATLKHQAVAPWSWSEMHPETQPITNDPSTISASPAEGSQRKRLTFFKK